MAGGAAGVVVGTAILSWFSVRLQQVLVATEQASALAVAEADARHDPLTTLPNRRGLEEYAAQITAAGLPAVIALADIDHFKAVNDTYGHDAGDVILFAVAQRLHHACRTQRPPWPDMVGRWGGEEFVLILPRLPADAAPPASRPCAARSTTAPCPVRATRCASPCRWAPPWSMCRPCTSPPRWNARTRRCIAPKPAAATACDGTRPCCPPWGRHPPSGAGSGAPAH